MIDDAVARNQKIMHGKFAAPISVPCLVSCALVCLFCGFFLSYGNIFQFIGWEVFVLDYVIEDI
jgi:hypothetical protein